MKRDYTECPWALQCNVYLAEAFCNSPYHKFLRKPVCYESKIPSLISRIAGRFVKGILNMGGEDE